MTTIKKENEENFKLKIIEKYKILRAPIRQRLNDFKKVKETEYFYELIYCLLTPQSSARNADKVVTILKSRNFYESNFNPEKILAAKKNYIRFHKTKAQRLKELKKNFPVILNFLTNGSNKYDQREWLVKNVKGLGYKEASHFLRNIGKTDLAILDRHILRNLKRLNVIDDIPKTLTRKSYMLIEKKFKEFADEIGISMDELDLLFWSIETGEILK